jgi:hypothetical protein
MKEQTQYKHLRPKRPSNYRQLAVNGRIRAEIIYRQTVGTEPLTPEEVARDYSIPLEAVLEAIDYCLHNKEILDADRAMEEASIKAAGRDKWPYAPKDYKPET